MTTPILALDLATRAGWAARDAAGRVTWGVQGFPLKRGESPGMRFLRFRAWLREMLDLTGPTVVAYEQSLAAQRGGHAAALAHGLVAGLQAEAADRGVEITSIHPSSLKKHATGSGRASKADMVVAAGIARGLKLSETEALDDNQADAYHVLRWAAEEIGEPLA